MVPIPSPEVFFITIASSKKHSAPLGLGRGMAKCKVWRVGEGRPATCDFTPARRAQMQHLNFSVQRATVSVQRRLLFPSIRKPTRLHRPSTARGASASGGGSKESSTNSAPDAESTASSDAPAEELKYTSGSGGSWKNDQNPAKGFLAPEGEPQLWW